MEHRSASPSHYDDEAEHYDLLNAEGTQEINAVIECILRKHGVERVLDLTCGTGAQLTYLSERGYQTIGVDINEPMLAVAREKGLDVQAGDMRASQVGQFDAVLTIFNAVGHLTPADFEKTMQNVHRNLRPGGFYIFDIFNLSFLLDGDHIADLTIDWRRDGGRVRKVQYSTISRDGVLASYTTCIVDEELSCSVQTLQVYSRGQLEEMLKRSGFALLECAGADGAAFDETGTERLLITARTIN